MALTASRLCSRQPCKAAPKPRFTCWQFISVQWAYSAVATLWAVRSPLTWPACWRPLACAIGFSAEARSLGFRHAPDGQAVGAAALGAAVAMGKNDGVARLDIVALHQTIEHRP